MSKAREMMKGFDPKGENYEGGERLGEGVQKDPLAVMGRMHTEQKGAMATTQVIMERPEPRQVAVAIRGRRDEEHFRRKNDKSWLMTKRGRV